MCFAIRAGALTGEVSAYQVKTCNVVTKALNLGTCRPYVVGFITHEACMSSKNLFFFGREYTKPW